MEIALFGYRLNLQPWLFGTFVVCIGVFAGIQAWSAIRQQRVSWGTQTYHRSDDPIAFAIYTSLYCFGLIIAALGFVGWYFDLQIG